MKQGPFKMKAKSPMLKALIGNQGNLNAGLRSAIEAAPTKMKKESMAKMKKTPAKMKKESSMKMMDKKSPTKLTGKERRAAIEKAKSATYDSPRAKRKAVLEARKTANKAFIAAKKKKVVKDLSNVNEKIQKGAKNLSNKLKSKKKIVITKNDKNDKGDKGNKSVEGTGKYKGNKYSTDSKTGKTTVTTRDGKKFTTSKDISEYTNKNNKSNTRVEFNKAFKAASSSGKKTFTFKGKSYTTKIKKESSIKMVKKSPAKLKGLATTLAKYGKKAYNAVKGVKKTTPKPKKSTYVSDLKKGTVTETTPKGTKIVRDSWPNVKPGTKSSFPGTSTDAMGKVSPFDPMKRQVLFNKK